jgi:flagellar biosynthesis protein FlhF
MKVKRFTGANMQQALRLVSQELGADAVILSSKKVTEGFEVVAAVDYQNQGQSQNDQPRQNREIERQLQLQQELERARELSRESRSGVLRPEAPVRQASSARSVADWDAELNRNSRSDGRSEQRQESRPPQHQAANTHTRRAELRRDEDQSRHFATEKVVDSGVSDLIDKMNTELKELKNWMVSHGGNAWDTGRPLTWKQSQLWQRCQDVGLEPAWSDRIVAQINAELDAEESWKLALRQMALDLPIARAGSLDKGGVFALLGPTGAGKTTTIGKLAARAVIQHGPESVALVTIDNYRVAAHDQLRSVARILGVDLHTVPAGDDLGNVLARLGNKKAVLVDTAGLASQDSSFQEQLAMLKEVGNRSGRNGRMRCLLTLPLTSQGRCLQENYEHFKPAGLAGCIFTKLDECFSLGPAMSIAALTRLPIVLITDGPHIPDDLHYPEAGKLVKLAEQMARMARTRWQAAEALSLATRQAGSQHGVQ